MREPFYLPTHCHLIQHSLGLKGSLNIDDLLVSSLIKEGIELSCISNLDLSDPTLTLGALVDSLGFVVKKAVTANNLTRDG